jgi:hypothetical protein
VEKSIFFDDLFPKLRLIVEKSIFLEDLFPKLADAFDVSTQAMKRWIAEIRKYEGWDIEYCRMANRYVLKGIEKDEKIHFFLLISFFVPELVVLCRRFNKRLNLADSEKPRE